ncbi:universal stress protein [Nocardia sp. NBC_01503]|uniref:universal stress protein n=1 Tax=Nocardia sp. NBC_01503 TaxID=2975997 RepID=UPI002E7B87E4|nr:universal stress protein [Nocardia sp. NBC_01503]WTL30644.1 universal stress protein [Nocardia sp. NBC_01503]
MTSQHDSRPKEPNPPIVVAVDGSAISYQAAAWAAAEAALHGCPLEIVNSVAVPTGFGPGMVLTDSDVQWLYTDGQRVVAEATRVARASGVGNGLEITTDVTLEPTISYLLARSREARLVVLGSRGLGALRRGLLGSVVAAVSHHAQSPVAVIHGSAAADPVSASKPVLVGVDGSPNSVPALELAFEEASLRKVGLTALHAWSDVTGIPLPGWDSIREQEMEEFAQRLAGFGERYPDVEVNRILVMDRPVRALLDESENAQLLIVGSHGRGGFTGMLLGSTSAALLHSVDCPMIVVRQS